MDSFHQVRDTERYKRYKRTEQILREAGMYNITMQTQELEKKNALLQLEIEQFNRDVSAFVQDVLKNPQNKWLRDKILQKSQRRSKWTSKLLRALQATCCQVISIAPSIETMDVRCYYW